MCSLSRFASWLHSFENCAKLSCIFVLTLLEIRVFLKGVPFEPITSVENPKEFKPLIVEPLNHATLMRNGMPFQSTSNERLSPL